MQSALRNSHHQRSKGAPECAEHTESVRSDPHCRVLPPPQKAYGVGTHKIHCICRCEVHATAQAQTQACLWEGTLR